MKSATVLFQKKSQTKHGPNCSVRVALSTASALHRCVQLPEPARLANELKHHAHFTFCKQGADGKQQKADLKYPR
jgi:hypothetical protein